MALSLMGCGKPFWQKSSNPAPQAEDGYVQNAFGQRVSWKATVPVTLQVHSSFPDEFRPALNNAIKTWEAAAGRPLFILSPNVVSGALNPQKDGSNVIYYMNTWESDRSSEQARTSVYWVGNQIQEADIRINAYNYNFYMYTPVNASDVHMESLLIHELGHVLGLKHIDGVGSVMATYLNPDTVRVSLAPVDTSHLGVEYQ